MTFDLDIWHAGSPLQCRSHLKVKATGQSLRSHEENVAKVVGSTSSEGFLVDRKMTKMDKNHIQRSH